MSNFVSGLGGIEETKAAVNWLREEAKKAGLPGVHFQFIRWCDNGHNITGVDGTRTPIAPDCYEAMGFDSLTHYQFVHFADIDREYEEILSDVEKEWEAIDKEHNIPYFPHISVGWDNNPRFKEFRPGVVKNNTPEKFEKALLMAKDYADKNDVSLITINSWNEWTETSYLLPDNVNGYGYLEAIKKVFCK